MADGSFTNGATTALKAVVEDGMQKKLPFNTLRHAVAQVGKLHGVFVYGTDRIDSTIYVTYDGGEVVSVKETAAYSSAVAVSTW